MKIFSAFVVGLLIGAAIICLIALPYRYTILETSIASDGQRLPVFVKYDRLTGKSWQKNALQRDWILVRENPYDRFDPSKPYTVLSTNKPWEAYKKTTNAVPDWATNPTVK